MKHLIGARVRFIQDPLKTGTIVGPVTLSPLGGQRQPVRWDRTGTVTDWAPVFLVAEDTHYADISELAICASGLVYVKCLNDFFQLEGVWPMSEDGKQPEGTKQYELTQYGDPPKTLGHIAFDAYGTCRHWLDVRGGPMPQWDDVRPEIRAAWEVAAAAVVMALPPTNESVG